MAEDYGAAVNEWVNVVRRARLDSTVKLIALILASYANPDGSRVYPGLARLTVQSRVRYATVKRSLRVLRESGLIELTKRGNRRAGRADEYRLILGEDMLERVHVPTPEQERKAVEQVKEADREASRQRYERRRSRVASGSVEPVDNSLSESLARHSRDTRDPVSRVTGDPVNGVSRYTRDRDSRVTTDPPPSIRTSPSSNPPSVAGDLPTHLAVGGGSGGRESKPVESSEVEGDVPLASLASDEEQRCRCGGWLRPDGTCLIPGCPYGGP